MNKLKRLWVSLFIPRHSPYCHFKLKPSKDGLGYTGKVCRYWKMLDEKDECGCNICYCKLLKQKSEYQDPFNLIWDECKECGINEER